MQQTPFCLNAGPSYDLSQLVRGCWQRDYVRETALFVRYLSHFPKMDAPPSYAETLEHILNFLRTEGFYAAEDALRGEIENRLPEGTSSATTSTSSPHPRTNEGAFGEDLSVPYLPAPPVPLQGLSEEKSPAR